MPNDDTPLMGFVREMNPQIKGIRPNMAFLLDGPVVSFFDSNIPENAAVFSSLSKHFEEGKAEADSQVMCYVPAKRQRAIIHVSGRLMLEGEAQSFRVIEYVVWPDCACLDELNEISFTGPCIDSFKPVQFSLSMETLDLSIPSPEMTKTRGGVAKVLGRDVRLESTVGYRFSFNRRELSFTSALKAIVNGSDLSFLGELYLAVRSSVEFCIGRSNLDIKASLHFDKALTLGEYVSFRTSSAIPDELDEPSQNFVRADDIGEGFSLILEAICSHLIEHPSFSSSRRDSNLLTRAKVIELTSAFESEFNRDYSEGVLHSNKSRRAREEAAAILREIEGGLTEESSESPESFLGEFAFLLESDRLRDKVVAAIEAAMTNANKRTRSKLREARKEMLRDSLQSRIEHALENTPSEVADACKRGIALPDGGGIGKAIVDARNAVAHSSEGRELIHSARGEYLMLRRLVFAMQLERAGFESCEVARLVRLMS